MQRKQRPPPTGGRGLKKIHYQKNFGEDLFAEQQIKERPLPVGDRDLGKLHI